MVQQLGYMKHSEYDILSPSIIYPLCVFLFMFAGVSELTLLSGVLFFIFLLSYFIGGLVKKSDKKSFSWIWKLGIPLMIIGVISELINFYFVGGIPLLNLTLRKKMYAFLTYLSFLIVPGCVILLTKSLFKKKYFEAMGWFLIGLFLISLVGYRTEILALVFSSLIVFYYTNSWLQDLAKKYASLLFGIIILFLLIININGIEIGSLSLRPSITLSVFSSITSRLGFSMFGYTHGVLTQSIFSSLRIIPGPSWGPRGIVSFLIGMGDVTTTSTILGIPYIDFGVVGIIIMGLILGVLFSKGYECLKKGSKDILPIHALCLSFLILTIETGIGDIIVIIYLLIYALMEFI